MKNYFIMFMILLFNYVLIYLFARQLKVNYFIMFSFIFLSFFIIYFPLHKLVESKPYIALITYFHYFVTSFMFEITTGQSIYLWTLTIWRAIFK